MICSFSVWLAQTLGTSEWVVAPRLTDYLRRKGYVLAISQKRFTQLKADYEASQVQS